MVKINKQLVSTSIRNSSTNGMNNSLNYITIHETANSAAGANAQMHAKLQSNGNSRAASWHYTCGSDGVYQSYPDKAQCWHAGSSYNDTSIGVEICVNSDGNYKKAVQNAADLTKHLMNKYNIPIKNVITHKHASTWGKPCPANMLNGAKGIRWADFLEMIGGSSGKVSSGSTSKPSTSSGNMGLVDYMNSKGMDSSYGNREKLAKQYGISGYKGTASQNTTLLSKIKSGKPKSSGGGKSISKLVDETLAGKHGNGAARKKSLGSNYQAVMDVINGKSSGGGSSKSSGKSIAQMAKEVSQGLHGNGHANRRKSLGVSKATYEKVRAKVNGGSVSSGGGKSVKQMADEIINGKGIPNGHEARRKHFGISKAKYEKVRAEVNRRL